MESSPAACWAIYGECSHAEYSDITSRGAPSYGGHICRQHPGGDFGRAIVESVGAPGFDVPDARAGLFLGTRHAVLQAAVEVVGFEWLERPAHHGEITVAHVAQGSTAMEHIERVHEWSTSVWNAWSGHHAVVKAWAAQAIAPRTRSRV
jgi:hypothetical protein